jgi:hypothetical protein
MNTVQTLETMKNLIQQRGHRSYKTWKNSLQGLCVMEAYAMAVGRTENDWAQYCWPGRNEVLEALVDQIPSRHLLKISPDFSSGETLWRWNDRFCDGAKGVISLIDAAIASELMKELDTDLETLENRRLVTA